MRRRQPAQTTSASSLNSKPQSAEKKRSSHAPHLPPSYAHSLQIHQTAAPSPLSAEAPVQNYQGFQNLVMLLLFVNNLRLILENLLKYGLLISFGDDAHKRDDGWRALFLVASVPWFYAIALILEWFHFAWDPVDARVPADDPVRRRRMWIVVYMHAINCVLALVLPNLYAYLFMEDPLLISLPCFLSVIMTLKLISFAFTNRDLRRAVLDGDPILVYGEDVVYPNNLTIKNIAYFAVAPTLCYQPSYPMTNKFRPAFFLKRLLELVIVCTMALGITEQYIRPTLKNSLEPFAALKFSALAERVLKLSIPSIYVWLLMFYGLFHSYLNMVAELLYFADRQFYKPWWNASTIGEYWRLWNLPVYQWFKRHVYIPVRSKHGYGKFMAGLATFFISAVAHEVLVGVPTHCVEGWAFLGMMSQVPMIAMTEFVHHLETAYLQRDYEHRLRQAKLQQQEEMDQETHHQHEETVPSPESHLPPVKPGIRRRRGTIGNYMFWISFCILGQPLSVLLYYRAWYLRQQQQLSGTGTGKWF